MRAVTSGFVNFHVGRHDFRRGSGDVRWVLCISAVVGLVRSFCIIVVLL